MMLASVGLNVPRLPDGAPAVWNRRVEIMVAPNAADLQDMMNAFLEDLGVNPDYALGAAVLEIEVFFDGSQEIGVIDYGFFTTS